MLLGELPAIQKLKTNIDKSFHQFKLVQQLRSTVNINTVMGMSIITAINEAKSDHQILSFIQSQAKDNPEVMSLIIGQQLCNEILNLTL